MTALRWAFAVDLYLLVGALLMLVANELLSGRMPRREFVLGMLIWPELLRRWAAEVCLSYVRRIRG